MSVNKLIKSTGIALLVGVLFYFLYRETSRATKLNQLTNDLSVSNDSLKIVRSKYDSLYTSYMVIQNQIEQSQMKLKALKTNLDSSRLANVHELVFIGNTINQLMTAQSDFVSIDSVKTNFRLQ